MTHTLQSILDTLPSILLQVEDEGGIEAWEIEGPDAYGNFEAVREETVDGPGWEISRSAGAYLITYMYGWYRQEGETVRLHEVPAICHTMVDAGRAFTKGLDERMRAMENR